MRTFWYNKYGKTFIRQYLKPPQKPYIYSIVTLINKGLVSSLSRLNGKSPGNAPVLSAKSAILKRQAEGNFIALGKLCTLDAITPDLLGELRFLNHRKTKLLEEHLLVC